MQQSVGSHARAAASQSAPQPTGRPDRRGCPDRRPPELSTTPAYGRLVSAPREGNVWIRIFPDKPITKKPAEVRMGKGKGNPEYWASVIEPGRILFECDGVSEATAKEAMGLAAQKLPIKTRFVVRRDLQS